jgi:hypothetical protein
MLSNSWINCGSIASLTCTRVAGSMPTTVAARSGRCARRSSSTASGTRALPRRSVPPGHRPRPGVVDHHVDEVANDHAGDVSEPDDDVEAFRTRRAAAAYQAWYEHIPVSKSNLPTALTTPSTGPSRTATSCASRCSTPASTRSDQQAARRALRRTARSATRFSSCATRRGPNYIAR